MSLDILIHKNTYTKTHTSFIYSLVKHIEQHHVINVHEKLYDMYYLFSPKKIFLQIEEYTNEWHSFISDEVGPQIFISIDNNKTKQADYISLLRQIHDSNATFIVPLELNKVLQSEQIHLTKHIEYNNLYNSDVFFDFGVEQKNEKTLCIMSTDKDCVTVLSDVLYPKTKEPLVLVNNIEVEHEQNIGLMFDSDLNIALNTYKNVLDLSGSYLAEIVACNASISSYDKNTYPSKEELITTDSFIKQHIL